MRQIIESQYENMIVRMGFTLRVIIGLYMVQIDVAVAPTRTKCKKIIRNMRWKEGYISPTYQRNAGIFRHIYNMLQKTMPLWKEQGCDVIIVTPNNRRLYSAYRRLRKYGWVRHKNHYTYSLHEKKDTITLLPNMSKKDTDGCINLLKKVFQKSSISGEVYYDWMTVECTVDQKCILLFALLEHGYIISDAPNTHHPIYVIEREL